MARVERTVFISYRRTNAPWALAIFQNLTGHGYDVFFDYTSIASGDFESTVLESIRARAHFLVLLTPSALERCGEPGDWLRREVETALDTRRNIVPLMLEGFDFDTPAIARQLTGTLAPLKRYQALRVPTDFFGEAMARLREKYFNVALEAVVHPVSRETSRAVQAHQSAASVAPAVEERALAALGWFEKGYKTTDLDEGIRCNTEAIRLRPDFAEAYQNRGVERGTKGDHDGAIEDLTEAIRLKPDDPEAYHNRGVVRLNKRDLDGAIADSTEAVRLKPTFAKAYDNRGLARFAKGDLDGAIRDCTQAIVLEPEFAEAYNNRGFARAAKGDREGALRDYTEAIRLKHDNAPAYNNRGNARAANRDLDGAIRDYTEAIRLNHDFAEAYYGRAESWEKKTNRVAAASDYQAYLDLGGGRRHGDQAEVEKRIKKLRLGE